MEVGLGLQSDKRPGEYTAIARRAEAAGFDVITVFHDLLYQPAIVPLTLIAQATEPRPPRAGRAECAHTPSRRARRAGRRTRSRLERPRVPRCDRRRVARPARPRHRRAARAHAGDGGDRAPPVRRRPLGIQRRALHARAGHRLRVRAAARPHAVADRHLEAAHGRARRPDRRRGEDRRLREPGHGAADARAGSATTTSGSSSAP